MRNADSATRCKPVHAAVACAPLTAIGVLGLWRTEEADGKCQERLEDTIAYRPPVPPATRTKSEY